MCGCSGTYKVASAHRAAADLDRGYPHGDEDISDRSVALTVKKILAFPGLCEIKSDYVALERDGRIYVAYFVPPAEKTVAKLARAGSYEI